MLHITLARWSAFFSCLFLVAGTTCVRSADFNGDGKQDIVWRQPAGNPFIWEMNGLAVLSPKTVATAPDAGSSIVGTGNFFGNGSNGIAWIDSTHRLDVWQLDGDGNVLRACSAATDIDATWNFLGIGDIDGDGIDDVLWRLPDGSVAAFLLNGCNEPATLTLQGTADASWTFAGVGDINRDRHADLFWLDADASHVIVWETGSDGSVTPTTLAAGAQAGWKICAIADFDGDGKADILWRSPDSSQVVIGSLASGSYTTTTVTATSKQLLDDIFGDGFDADLLSIPLVLPADFAIIGTGDFNGDGDADVLLADNNGNVAILLMQNATVEASTVIAQSGDMPLPGLTGWRLPLDRPTIVKADDRVAIAWSPLSGSPVYAMFASANNDPSNTGVAIPSVISPFYFERNDAGYSDKRYFAITATYNGIQLPPSPEAYIVEFSPTNVSVWGAMAVGDINGDGCIDILGTKGDCHGNFAPLSETTLGLGALRAPGRQYRDVRFADFNGDGIPDAIANVYGCDTDGCGGDDATSKILLFFGNADGTFTENAPFTALNIPGGGFGETIVIADFNNDGHLDIFLPKYTFYDPSEHNFLLINDGHGNFTDVADAAGVAMRNVAIGYRPEGAQAVDLNSDGWIDLYAGSHLFINNGNLTFTNVGATIDLTGVTAESPWGLPAVFDEGAKFIDWNNSGQLALAINDVYGLRLFQYDGLQHFTEEIVMPSVYINSAYGLTAADVDGNGRTDLIVAGGYDKSVETDEMFEELKDELKKASNDFDLWSKDSLKLELNEAMENSDAEHDVADDTPTPNGLPQLLVNYGQFFLYDFYDDGLQPTSRGWNDLQTFADFDVNGTTDLISRFGPTTTQPNGALTILMNKATSGDVITITVVGDHGEHNQMGRVVRVVPNARSAVTMTQVVDGGSGYMGNGPYDLTFATPYPGAYKITIRFANETYTAPARKGQHVTMSSNGTVSYQ